MKIKAASILLSLLCAYAHAAGPIMHIVLALKALGHLPATFDKKAFIVGTSFPDIRYLAKIERNKTHIEPATWHDVVHAKNAFQAGMIFHNLVDNIRMTYFEPFYYQRGAPYSTSYIQFFPLFMKTAEDHLLYDRLNNWHEISAYFDAIYQEELDFGIDALTIKTWHKKLQQYMQTQPNIASVMPFISPQNKELLENACTFDYKKAFDNLIHSKDFKQKLNHFYDTFFPPSTNGKQLK